jgi:hypothetical protein
VNDAHHRQEKGKKSGQKIRTYGGLSDIKIIVDAFFSSKMKSDFQKFPKFWKNLENFTPVLEFFGEFLPVF